MNYEENLNKTRKILDFADHMTYITFPLVKENKLIIKILLEIEKALKSLISSILQYEYSFKRIPIYKDPELNFKIFLRLAKKYDISEQEIQDIKRILFLAKKHKNSEFEFTKDRKFVIMSQTNTFSLSLEKVKSFLKTLKNILKKAEFIINTKK